VARPLRDGARAFGAQGPEEAEKSAIQARDLMPDNSAVYLVLANIHIHCGTTRTAQRSRYYLKLSPMARRPIKPAKLETIAGSDAE